MTKYLFYFLASLFSANLTQITDGSIKCPVVVIASRQDNLFPYEYSCKVFDRIVAPEKDMITFERLPHLLFNECVDEVIDPIVNRLNVYVEINY